ncbi:MAG: cysteine synthase [Cellvibrio sp.]|nr:cysteine synthase [Cellvibrio sp.]
MTTVLSNMLSNTSSNTLSNTLSSATSTAPSNALHTNSLQTNSLHTNSLHTNAQKVPVITRVSDDIGGCAFFELVTTANHCRLLVKLEQNNPTGSVKIRMAKQMVDEAESSGLLKPGGWIVESTSGNTGVALALIAAERGYRFTAVVDNHAAQDKIRMMRALGAEVICISAAGDEELATAARDETAAELAKNYGAVWTAQHHNPANSRGYYPMAEEIYATLGDGLTHLVGAVGTGGSLCGTAKALKHKGARPQIIGVEPEGSIIFGGPGKAYMQSGTGTPEGAEIGQLIEYDLIDKGLKVTDQYAFLTARMLAKRKGLMVGGSAGGVIYQALLELSRAPANSNIVVVICDAGEKYLDTVYNDEWMKKHSLLDDSVTAEIESLLDALERPDKECAPEIDYPELSAIPIFPLAKA